MKNILCCLLLSLTHMAYSQDRYLKDQYTFPIGASVNPRLLTTNEAYRNIASSEFNSITAENHMKMMLIHPAADRFDFTKGDEIVAFAAKTGKRMHGHTLVWHNQVPQWMKDFQGDQKPGKIC